MKVKYINSPTLFNEGVLVHEIGIISNIKKLFVYNIEVKDHQVIYTYYYLKNGKLTYKGEYLTSKEAVEHNGFDIVTKEIKKRFI